MLGNQIYSTKTIEGNNQFNLLNKIKTQTIHGTNRLNLYNVTIFKQAYVKQTPLH